MTKKDYEKAAEIVRSFIPAGRWQAPQEAFIELFSGENPRFDVERFRKACMPKEK